MDYDPEHPNLTRVRLEEGDKIQVLEGTVVVEIPFGTSYRLNAGT